MPNQNLKSEYVREEGFREIEEVLEDLEDIIGASIKEEGRTITEEAVEKVKDAAPTGREVGDDKSRDIKEGVLPIIKESDRSYTFGIDSRHEETTQYEFGSSKSPGRVFFRIGLGHMIRNLTGRIERNLAKRISERSKGFIETEIDDVEDVWVRTE